MSADLISQVFLPLSLVVIMIGMGMTLVFDDFARIVKYPKAVLIGLFSQLILLPVFGFALAVLFNLESSMAIGLMIIAVCPGGATSNLIAQVCRGNIALSVSLTSIASFVSVISIPIILSYSIGYFGTSVGQEIEMPILSTILQILFIIVIPICIGMIIRKYKEGFADRMEKPMRNASTVLFILVFIAVVVANLDIIGDAMKSVGLVTLFLNLITLTAGYLLAKLFGLTFENVISITIESGIQNGTLAIVIATTVLSNIELGIPAAAYSVWMFVSGGILMWYFGKYKSRG